MIDDELEDDGYDIVSVDPDDDDGDELQVVPPEVVAMLRDFVEKRNERDNAKKKWVKAKDECETAELDVFDLFVAAGSDGEPRIKGQIKVNLGPPHGWVAFRTRETHFATVEDEDAAAEWYEQRAMSEEVTTIKFSMKRLHEDVRQAIEMGEDLPDGLAYYTRRGMTVTKQK